MKTYTFHISGTHCASCKILIEDILDSATVDLKKETIKIQSHDLDEDALLEKINNKLKTHNYEVSKEKQLKVNKVDLSWQAIPIGLVFLFLFFILQKSGILNFGIGGSVTPTTSFIIGVIASFSSCLAVVGGLILSLSAKVLSDDTNNKKPIYLFHIARLVSFAVFGGVLGFIGKSIGINFVLSSVLGIIAALIMIILGLNLFGIFKKNKITLPHGMFNFFRKVEHSFWAPIVIGAATFLLPCGFTQSMQVVALSSESFIKGFMIMLFFALGTLPVLLLLSFGSVSFVHSKYKDLFFKVAGVVVLGLGIFALLSAFVGLGIIKPFFNI